MGRADALLDGVGYGHDRYPLLAFTATGSAAAAGAVACAGLIVAVGVRLPAGALADRYPLKPLMIVPDLIRAVTTLSVLAAVVADRVSVTHLVGATIVSSACGVVFDSAQMVALRHVVRPDQLTQAFAQDAARGHIASLIGPPAGGYLYGLGAALPVLANALSYLACAALTLRVRTFLDPSPVPAPPHLQGRVISAAMLTAGIAAPLGPPLTGLLLDAVGQGPTFSAFAGVAAGLTFALHLSPSVRHMGKPIDRTGSISCEEVPERHEPMDSL